LSLVGRAERSMASLKIAGRCERCCSLLLYQVTSLRELVGCRRAPPLSPLSCSVGLVSGDYGEPRPASRARTIADDDAESVDLHIQGVAVGDNTAE
jgi:hypothetical protein